MKKITIKKVMLSAALALPTHLSFAALPVTVPTQICTAFMNKYPGAKAVKWKEKDGLYEAVFKLDGQKSFADFKTTGAWVSTKQEIHTGRLPQKVKTALRQSRFASFYIDETVLVTMANASEYRIHVDNHSGSTTVSEGYGSAEDDLLTLDLQGQINAVREL